jgi:hypothetical protein
LDIHLHIDRVVLEDVTLPPGGRAALGTALEAELSRLLAAGGLAEAWQAGAAVPRLAAGPVSLAGSPADLGVGIARSVYVGLGPAGGER